MAHAGDWLVRNLAALWYRLDRRHRRITLANLEFAYGSDAQPRRRGSAWPGGSSAISCASPGKCSNCSWPRCR